MPVYVEVLKIPANTPETSPVERRITIEPGVVHRWSVLFPAGCHTLVRFAILYGESHIFPAGKGRWIRGDDETVVYDDRWHTPDRPTTLRLVGWSEDDTFDHTLYIRIGVLPPEEVSFVRTVEIMAQKLANALMRAFGWV